MNGNRLLVLITVHAKRHGLLWNLKQNHLIVETDIPHIKVEIILFWCFQIFNQGEFFEHLMNMYSKCNIVPARNIDFGLCNRFYGN